MPNINKIKLSGTSYDIQDANATKTVELTQAQYDALVTGGTVDSNTFYVITDGEMFNPSGKVDTSAFTEFSGAVETELSGKTDESAFTAHTGDSTIHVTTAQTAAWNAKSDFSGSYNDLTDKPTIPTVPTSNTAFTNDAGYATSGYVDSAVSGKANSSDVYTKSQTSGATEISTALNAKLDATAYTPTDLSNYYQKSETSGATQISDALSGKQDTLSAGTNITIVDNVISAEGGGKAVTGGTNISITTGETADTINCTLPITINNSKTTILPNNANNTANGSYNFVGGRYCQITNYAGGAYPDYAFCHGYYNTVTTEGEAAFGIYNQTKNAGGAAGVSGTSIFTIGNGNWTSRRHNALEVMQNGDIYIADTNDTSTSNYYQKPMIKLQDALGGGGIDSGTVQTMIDESISGKTDESAFTAHTADTTIHVTTAQTASWDGAVSDISTISGDVASLSGDVATVSGAIPSTYVSSISKDTDQGWKRFVRFSTPSNINYFILDNPKINGTPIHIFDGIPSNFHNFSLVETSAITTSVTSSSTDSQVPSAKAVNDKLGGLSLVKLTQSEYDALATKDSNTLYVING